MCRGGLHVRGAGAPCHGGHRERDTPTAADFERYSVNSINQYTPLCKNGGADTPVPHLFIIVDEFAELKREQPEFMRKLISVAHVGRSLGVHLILATQRPAGNVDENILSNTRFRLCLRVQDKQNSMEVLHRPDGGLTGAGRGYLQVGSDEVFTLFQSGWSGAPPRRPLRWPSIDTTGRPVQPAAKAAAPGAATAPRWTICAPRLSVCTCPRCRRSGCRRCPPGWLLPAAPMARAACAVGAFRHCGPHRRPRKPVSAAAGRQLYGGRHHALVGAPGSGKSTFNRDTAPRPRAAVHARRPQYLRAGLHIPPHSGLRGLPQVGAVLDATDLSRVGRLFALLDGLLTERQTRLRGGNYTQYVAAHDVRGCPPCCWWWT